MLFRAVSVSSSGKGNRHVKLISYPAENVIKLLLTSVKMCFIIGGQYAVVRFVENGLCVDIITDVRAQALIFLLIVRVASHAT